MNTFSSALGPGESSPAGSFSYYPATRRWVWSEALYSIHGYRLGEIVPSTELMLSHVYPDDRAQTRDMMDRALSAGDPFSDYRRLVDASGRVRQVLATGIGVSGAGGTVALVHGVLTDLTRTLQRETEAAASTAVERSAESRAVIEQLKGALMGRFRVDAAPAFALILTRSQQLNLRVRDLVDSAVRDLAAGLDDPLGAYRPVTTLDALPGATASRR